MPPTCSICGHAARTAIEAAMAAGSPLRAIARQYGTTHSALARHRDGCGALVVADARQSADDARQGTVRGELERVLTRVNKLYDACDAYLQDSEHPERYDIGPRAEDITVIYSLPLDEEGTIRVRGKERLSTLVARIEAHGGEDRRVVATEYKVADPRTLILATAGQLTRQLELLAKLTGELDTRPVVNILAVPQWAAIEEALARALAPYPHVLEAVRVELAGIE